MDRGSLKLAVLIDGDNISADAMDRLFETIATLGDPIVRIVYRGQTLSKKWKQAGIRHALSFGRRHPQATGHNATDIEMVIGAMDIMSDGDVDGLCLVSSDRDFTSLAIRLREGGKLVYGFGDKRAPDSLRHACDVFRDLETALKKTTPAPSKRLPLTQAIKWLNEAFDACALDGWASLSDVRNQVKLRHSGFSPKNYGSAGMKKLVKLCDVFELDPEKDGNRFRPLTAKRALKLVKA